MLVGLSYRSCMNVKALVAGLFVLRRCHVVLPFIIGSKRAQQHRRSWMLVGTELALLRVALPFCVMIKRLLLSFRDDGAFCSLERLLLS